jgi:hypothetical protein
MENREKVIGGLAACTGETNDYAGHTCPYWDFDDSVIDHGCRIQMELDALALLKEQEAVEPDTDSEGTCSCGNCGETVGYYPVGCNVPERLCKFCPECGKAVQWDDCV